MKKKEKETTDGITYANFNNDHPEFYKWWKKHRHSGYVEDCEGKAHWNTLPVEAWYIDKYRVEFSIDTVSPYHTKHNYTAEEIEKWAAEQKEMEDYVQGDYRCVDVNDFLVELNRASRMLAAKFSVKDEQ
jgi:hypothetical protein